MGSTAPGGPRTRAWSFGRRVGGDVADGAEGLACDHRLVAPRSRGRGSHQFSLRLQPRMGEWLASRPHDLLGLVGRDELRILLAPVHSGSWDGGGYWCGVFVLRCRA